MTAATVRHHATGDMWADAPATAAVGKIVHRSGNAKTGPIPVTSRAQWSCPTTCAFFGNGCYGENTGRGGSATLFQRADSAEGVWDAATMAGEMARNSGRPRAGQARARMLVRDREVGDILDADGNVDHSWLYVVAEAARRVGRTVFGYTHVPFATAADVPVGYVMNASCETPAGVRDAWSRGLPAVIVGDRDALQAQDPTPRYVACPAESRDVTCTECGLCARESRMADPEGSPVIVFAPHGSRVRRAREAVARRLASA